MATETEPRLDPTSPDQSWDDVIRHRVAGLYGPRKAEQLVPSRRRRRRLAVENVVDELLNNDDDIARLLPRRRF